MISSYLKIAIRNLLKNRVYSFINIAGLAVGLAGSILVLFWVNDELRYNKFHTKLPNIHLILQNQTQNGQKYTFEALPGPLAEALRAEIPEIKQAVRFSWSGSHLLNVGDKGFYERGAYAEPGFFELLTFPALYGDPVAALKDVGSVVITERTAMKLFGEANVVGKSLRHNNQRDLKIGAVVQNVPPGSTLRFDILLPFRIYEQSNADWIHTWNNNSLPTWVELQPGTDLQALNAKLENFIQTKEPDAVAHIHAYPLSRWRLYGRFVNGHPSGGRITLLMLMSIIGVFILLIACINFMNLSTARSERRAREVGVRKVVGARRGLIIGQFLSEALIMTFIALGLGLLIAQLALPAFNRFFDKTFALTLANWQIWSGLLALGLMTGLVAGSYPAIFLSRFQPVQVLKGWMAGRDRWTSVFRRSLVAFQFVISVFLIITTIVIYLQIHHTQNRPLGYDAEHLIRIPARGSMSGKLDVLKNDLIQIPGVQGVSASNHNIVECGSNTSGIEWPGKTEDQDFLISVNNVGYDWTATSGMSLVAGRDFSPLFADSSNCLINETAVRLMGLKEPVGTVLNHGQPITVIGVVKDFVYNNPTEDPRPMVMYLNTGEMSNFFVRLRNDAHWKGSLSQIENTLKKHNPGYPFEVRFTKDEYQATFDEIRATGRLANIFGGLAIFISCLGLFGLSAFVAERRSKEIGIRKVLGASIAGICLTLSKDFLKPVLIGFAIAAPLAGWAMTLLLARFDYRVSLYWWIFVLAGLIAVGSALLVIAGQTLRAATSNPSKSLRAE